MGTTVLGRTLPNGIRLTQSRVPMGVIGAIYEARPNVTVDIAILALKAGNASILRGGSAAENTNAELVSVLRRAVESVRLPADTISTIDQYGRDGASVLMNSRDYVDLLIRAAAPSSSTPSSRIRSSPSSRPGSATSTCSSTPRRP